MPDDDSGGWLSDAIDSGADVVRKTRSFLGVEREAFVCPSCGVACEETHVFDPARAAFDGGQSPAWHCDSCDTNYVRETDDIERHTSDLYER